MALYGRGRSLPVGFTPPLYHQGMDTGWHAVTTTSAPSKPSNDAGSSSGDSTMRQYHHHWEWYLTDAGATLATRTGRRFS